MKDGMLKRIRRKGQYIAAAILPDEFLNGIYSKAVIGYKGNLKNPQTFNDKMQWYKLFYCANNKLVSQCADKYEVRPYLEAKGCGEYLNELYGVWDNEKDICWDNLPNQFVLKCTHGCAYNIICPDKSCLDVEASRKKISKWMHEDFGRFNLERHYSHMKPRIICEKYLGGNMTDYKFFCFNGKVEFMYISEGLDHDDTATIAFFDRDGNPSPFRRNDYAVNVEAKIPKEFRQLLDLSEKLAEDFPFVRVDWFDVGGKIYFSELTFVPCAGMMPFNPQEYDHKCGKLLDLTNAKVRNDYANRQ